MRVVILRKSPKRINPKTLTIKLTPNPTINVFWLRQPEEKPLRKINYELGR